MVNYTLKLLKCKAFKSNIKKAFEGVQFFERIRKFKDMKIFTNIFLRFIISGLSLLSLAHCYMVIAEQSITDTSFKKIFQKHDKFKQVFEKLLNNKEYSNRKNKKILGRKECFALDTTYLKEEGCNNEVYRIHTCYALTRNQISGVNVTDSHTAESVKNFNITKNALYLADRAYCTAQQIAFMHENNADFIFRMKYNGIKLYANKECTEAFNIAKYLSTKTGIVSKFVYLKYNKKTIQIKIVAKQLSDYIKAEHQKKTIRKAHKRGDKIKDDTLEMCGWLILATTVKNYSNKSILDTYRLRWQIELLFKRFKTFMDFHKIRKSSANYAFSYIYLSLIAYFSLELFIMKKNKYFVELKITSLWIQIAIAYSILFFYP